MKRRDFVDNASREPAVEHKNPAWPIRMSSIRAFLAATHHLPFFATAMISLALPVRAAQRITETQVPIAGRLAPDGAQAAFIVGDSIYVSNADGRNVRPLVGGVSFEAQASRKLLTWSPDSRFLLFRTGRAPFMNFVVVDVASGSSQNLLPDTVGTTLRTVGNLFTGPPSWSPSSDRIVFLGTTPGRFGSLNTVYLSSRAANGGWSMRALVSDSAELTALGWSGDHLLWSSRRANGAATVHVAQMVADSIHLKTSISGGTGRVTAFLPSPDGSRVLATKAGGVPVLIDLLPTPRALQTNLPAEAGLDASVGWVSASGILAFLAPSTWSSELAILDVATGHKRKVIAMGGRLSDGTVATTSRGVLAFFATEDGSHPRTWRSLSIAADESVSDGSFRTPARFTARADSWSSRIVTWRTQDGTALEAQLLSPSRLANRIPSAVIVPYGGYRNTALTNTYFVDALLRQLLDSGWQVIRPNTSAADVLRQKSGYGAVQLQDTEMLVRSLSASGMVDPRRVAILGHSHGASLAYYYATHSTSFCAVVAVNGRADWVMQARYDADGLFPGPLGATPDEDPVLYARASPVANASRVTANMLLVAGARDGQILPVNAVAMADSLRAYGRHSDLLVFEDEGHHIDSEMNRTELARRVVANLATCR